MMRLSASLEYLQKKKWFNSVLRSHRTDKQRHGSVDIFLGYFNLGYLNFMSNYCCQACSIGERSGDLVFLPLITSSGVLLSHAVTPLTITLTVWWISLCQIVDSNMFFKTLICDGFECFWILLLRTTEVSIGDVRRSGSWLSITTF